MVVITIMEEEEKGRAVRSMLPGDSIHFGASTAGIRFILIADGEADLYYGLGPPPPPPPKTLWQRIVAVFRP